MPYGLTRSALGARPWHATCSREERLLTGCSRIGKGPGSGVRAPSYRRHGKGAGLRKRFRPFFLFPKRFDFTRRGALVSCSSDLLHARSKLLRGAGGKTARALGVVERALARTAQSRARASIPHRVPA